MLPGTPARQSDTYVRNGPRTSAPRDGYASAPELLTAPRSSTGVERWHKTLSREFLNGNVFNDIADAQAQLDRWLHEYDHALGPKVSSFRSAEGPKPLVPCGHKR